MLDPTCNAFRLFARNVLPHSSFVSNETLTLARRLFMLGYVADPPEYAADGCFRFAEHDDVRLLAFLRQTVPQDAPEWVAAMRAQIFCESDRKLRTALRFLRGILSSRCARLGTLRMEDALRGSRRVGAISVIRSETDAVAPQPLRVALQRTA